MSNTLNNFPNESSAYSSPTIIGQEQVRFRFLSISVSHCIGGWYGALMLSA
jgi:hypothetical protein